MHVGFFNMYLILPSFEIDLNKNLLKINSNDCNCRKLNHCIVGYEIGNLLYSNGYSTVWLFDANSRAVICFVLTIPIITTYWNRRMNRKTKSRRNNLTNMETKNKQMKQRGRKSEFSEFSNFSKGQIFLGVVCVCKIYCVLKLIHLN